MYVIFIQDARLLLNPKDSLLVIDVLLISNFFFIPQQLFGEYYTGRCPDIGWT